VRDRESQPVHATGISRKSVRGTPGRAIVLTATIDLLVHRRHGTIIGRIGRDCMVVAGP